MKKLRTKLNLCTSTLLICFSFCSCIEPNVKEKNTGYVMDGLGGQLKSIEVDSCEYIFYENGHRMMMAHKGNCKFCTKRSKK